MITIRSVAPEFRLTWTWCVCMRKFKHKDEVWASIRGGEPQKCNLLIIYVCLMRWHRELNVATHINHGHPPYHLHLYDLYYPVFSLFGGQHVACILMASLHKISSLNMSRQVFPLWFGQVAKPRRHRCISLYLLLSLAFILVFSAFSPSSFCSFYILHRPNKYKSCVKRVEGISFSNEISYESCSPPLVMILLLSS